MRPPGHTYFFAACAFSAWLVAGRAQGQNGAPPARDAAPPAGTVAPSASSVALSAGSVAPSGVGAALAPAPAVEPPTSVDGADESAQGGSDRLRVRYLLEGIEVRGNVRTRDRVVLRYVPFRPGDLLDVGDPELTFTRYRLLGTGFFSSVRLWLRKGLRRGEVVLVVEVVERNTLVVNDVWMGLAKDATQEGEARPLGAYGGVDFAETNLAGTGITLGGAIGIAPDQYALRSRFIDPAFLGTGWMASATILYNSARDFFGHRDFFGDNRVLFVNPTGIESQDVATVPYTRFGGTIGAGHDLSVSTQLWFDFRIERIDASLPAAAASPRGTDIEPIDFGVIGGKSTLSSLRATLTFDTRDSPFLPTRGWYAALVADTSISPLGSDYGYTKLQFRVSRWWELAWHHVARLELYYGGIAGKAPFFEKFYVGDLSDLLPDRVLDLNFDRRPAPNFLKTDIVEVRYGDYAAKLQGEYRIPLYRGHRSVYGIDLFGAAGVYGVATLRDLTDPPRGYHGFQRIPIDLTFNLGFRADTSAGGFVFAFSNVLGLIPVRREAQP